MTSTLQAHSLLSPVPSGLGPGDTLAARPASLKDLNIGLLGNLKPNCDVLLKTLGDEIKNKLGARSVLFREKTSCSLGAGDPLLDEIARNCQVAIVALGD